MGPAGLRARRGRRLARGRRAALGPRQPVRRAAVRRRRRPLRLGGRRRPEPVAQRERDLRGARAQPERAAPRRPPGAARHLRRPGPPRVDRAPHPAGRDRGRAAAGARLHLRAAPRAPGDDEPLGLQHAGVLRPPRGLRLGGRPAGRGRRGQGDGQAPPPRGDRGPPRRRLQPHRRAGPHGCDAVVARAGPAGLLPPRRARARHRRHRLRQHARPPASGRVPHGPGLAAVLGARVPRRRLQVRPRRRAGPGPRRRLRPRPPVPRGAAHRPRALRRQAGCRALGRRDARLAHRPVPPTVHGVERPFPRRGAARLGRRRARPAARPARPQPRGAGDPAGRVARPVRAPRPRPDRLGELRRGPRRVHHRRPRRVRLQAQRGERGAEPRRQPG